MKNPNKNSVKGGFTLIELLVVIAIIAVLAAASFPVAIALKQKARQTTALAAANSLLQAINNYQKDDNSLSGIPASSNTSDPTLLNVLSGTEGGTDILNEKRTRYFEFKQAQKGNRDGLVYNSADQITGLYDPWGQPYYVELDTDYDQILEFSVLGKTEKLRGPSAAVYSLGVDNPAAAKPNKLVKTW